ncbi:MAG: indole-3-glycerol phosphate synthase TrpC [Actinomycetota bacterium]|jgi:indole-3-glycerol phosphate synthase
MTTYLDRIIAHHRQRAAVDDRSVANLVEECQGLPATRGFQHRLARDSRAGLAVISEIKRRSPSKGDLAIELDPVDLARRYEVAGASCLSVLTDEDFFAGSPSDLKAASAAASLPVLRKDFTVSPADVCDARLMGADCVLLIAAALSDEELSAFAQVARAVGIDFLVEIHDERELERALAIEPLMVGVNQRDLVTFQVDHDRAVRMAPRIPDGIIRVAESGVRGPDDARALAAAGYHAVLVGESLVTAADPVAAVRALRVGC